MYLITSLWKACAYIVQQQQCLWRNVINFRSKISEEITFIETVYYLYQQCKCLLTNVSVVTFFHNKKLPYLKYSAVAYNFSLLLQGFFGMFSKQSCNI